MKSLLIFAILFLLGVAPALAQNTNDSELLRKALPQAAVTPAGDHMTSQPPTPGNSVTDSLAASDNVYNAYDEYVKRKVIKSPEFMLSMMLLVFAIILCIAEIVVFLKGKLDADHIIKLLILTLIIFAVLLLIILGFTSEQISPAIGLLGTIAGYLLGRASTNSITSPAAEPKPADKVQNQHSQP